MSKFDDAISFLIETHRKAEALADKIDPKRLHKYSGKHGSVLKALDEISKTTARHLYEVRPGWSKGE